MMLQGVGNSELEVPVCFSLLFLNMLGVKSGNDSCSR